MYLLTDSISNAPAAPVGFARKTTRGVVQHFNRNAKVYTGVGVTAAGCVLASAQTDISSAVDAMSTLWTSIELIAVGVIVFVVGRKLFRKI